MTSFFFNFINLFEFFVVLAMVHRAKKERKKSKLKVLASGIERWSRVILPLFYMVFLVIFFSYVLSEHRLLPPRNKIVRKMTELKLEF